MILIIKKKSNQLRDSVSTIFSLCIQCWFYFCFLFFLTSTFLGRAVSFVDFGQHERFLKNIKRKIFGVKFQENAVHISRFSFLDNAFHEIKYKFSLWYTHTDIACFETGNRQTLMKYLFISIFSDKIKNFPFYLLFADRRIVFPKQFRTEPKKKNQICN